MPEQRPQPPAPGKPARRWKRTAATALLLILGAIVNVVVAWGCAIVCVPNPAKPESQWTALWQGYLIVDDHTWIINGYRRTGCVYINALRSRARSSPRSNTDVVDVQSIPKWSLFHAQSATTPLRMRHEFAFGLPLLCMTIHRDFDPVTGEEQTFDVLAAPALAQYLGPGRDLPTRIVLPGFIINTLFYALLLWLLFFAPFTARRMIRRRRGQCEKCAYPIGVSPVCTECGAPVRPLVARAS